MPKKSLVAFFSVGGTTANVAEQLAEVAGADLFEIIPEQEYTRADLNWNDPQSRATLEHADPAARPAIADAVDDMASYDVVFIGFPIWWYKQPAIIDTFLEGYDFSGKTLTLFATSGGTGLTKPEDELPARIPDATWKPGRLFNDGVAESTLRAWANGVLA